MTERPADARPALARLEHAAGGRLRVTRSSDETHAFARTLASALRPGDVLLLEGDLGAGKTTFVRGLAEGLGASPDEVSSPTFTLLHEYAGQDVRLYHADLYRLTPAAVDDLGLEEAVGTGGILAVEWPDRLPFEFPGAVTVSFRWVDGDAREILLG